MNAAGVAVRCPRAMKTRTMSKASRAVNPADIARRSITWLTESVDSSQRLLFATAWAAMAAVTAPTTRRVLTPPHATASIVQVAYRHRSCFMCSSQHDAPIFACRSAGRRGVVLGWLKGCKSQSLLAWE
jgi:hypothetical protein